MIEAVMAPNGSCRSRHQRRNLRSTCPCPASVALYALLACAAATCQGASTTPPAPPDLPEQLPPVSHVRSGCRNQTVFNWGSQCRDLAGGGLELVTRSAYCFEGAWLTYARVTRVRTVAGNQSATYDVQVTFGCSDGVTLGPFPPELHFNSQQTYTYETKNVAGGLPAMLYRGACGAASSNALQLLPKRLKNCDADLAELPASTQYFECPPGQTITGMKVTYGFDTPYGYTGVLCGYGTYPNPPAPPSPPPMPPRPPPPPSPPPMPPSGFMSWRDVCHAQAQCFSLRIRYLGVVTDDGTLPAAPFEVCMEWDSSRPGCGGSCGSCTSGRDAANVTSVCQTTSGILALQDPSSTGGFFMFNMHTDTTPVFKVAMPLIAVDVDGNTRVPASEAETVYSYIGATWDSVPAYHIEVAYSTGDPKDFENGKAQLDLVNGLCRPYPAARYQAQEACGSAALGMDNTCSDGWYAWQFMVGYAPRVGSTTLLTGARLMWG